MLRRPAIRAVGDVPPASDPALLDRIVGEIETSGPITFARFMELALYHPSLGYYRRLTPGPGRSGDFLTAPEMHPLFGATLARTVIEAWRTVGSPDRFAVVDYGAGRGALALPILEALADEEPALLQAVRYVPVELNEHRLAELRERFSNGGFGHTLAPDPPPTTGLAIANEYLDALPVHIVERRAGALVEVYVDARPDGALLEVVGPPSTPDLVARLQAENVALGEGQRAEVCLEVDAWVADLSARVRRGVVLVIDYGAPAGELYDPSRPAGTLMAYAGHRAHADPLVGIGHQDLTAHVDMTAVQQALVVRGWEASPLTTQAAFLVRAGMETVLATFRERAPDIEAQLVLRSAACRLLDPRMTGSFRVLEARRSVAGDSS